MFNSRALCALCLSLVFVSVTSQLAFAQNKPKGIDPDQIFKTEVTLQFTKKKKNGKGNKVKEVVVPVSCAPAGSNNEVIGGKPGKKIKKGAAKGLRKWVSFGQLLRKARASLRNLKRSGKGSSARAMKTKNKMARYKALRVSATDACQRVTAGGNDPEDPNDPNDPNDPEDPEDPELPTGLLDPYTGPFGLREAAILYQRFGFGGTYSDLQLAVQEGLEATVNRMLTWNGGDDLLLPEFNDLKCDGRPSTDENNEECILMDPNDFSIEGLKRAWYYYLSNTANPVHMKLLTIWHSENASGQIDELASNDEDLRAKRWFADAHFEHLKRAAKDLDYRMFLQEQAVGGQSGVGVADPLVAAFNLDLAVSFSSTGQNGVQNPQPNENYARELMELAGPGVNRIEADANGNLVISPTYGVLDVLNAALTLAGLGYSRRTFETGALDNQGVPITTTVDYLAYVPANEIPGSRQLFMGTPDEVTVNNRQELVEAVMNHSMTSYNMARKLIVNTVNENPSHGDVLQIANIMANDGLKLKNSLRTLMMARVNYLPEGQRPEVLKSMFDFIIGIVRSTRIPFSMADVSNAMRQCGQELGWAGNRPAGRIFGWDIKGLHSQSNVIPCRNAIVNLLESVEGVENYYRQPEVGGENYSVIFDTLFTEKPLEQRADFFLVDKLSTIFAMPLNPAQRNYLVFDYLNKRPELCNTTAEQQQYGCGPEDYYPADEPMSNSPFDNYNNFIRKVSDALAAFVLSENFHVK